MNKKPLLTLREICIFPMLATMMFCSKILMEFLPNIHLLGMFTMIFAVAFGVKGLIPLYLYIFINGLYSGFALWWYPYLYIWTVLWAMTMLIPKSLPTKAKCIIYPIVCCLHGLLFGTLYAPGQALLFGFNFKQTVTWIITGLPWDLVHGVSNLFTGMLVYPLSTVIIKLTKNKT